MDSNNGVDNDSDNDKDNNKNNNKNNINGREVLANYLSDTLGDY